MSFKFSADALETLSTALKNADPHNANVGEVYDAIIAGITSTFLGSDPYPKLGVDPASYVFLIGARTVNLDIGSFPTYIRNYSASQVTQRGDAPTSDLKAPSGDPLSDAIQFASNNIGVAIAESIIDTGSLPDLHQLGLFDASGVAATLLKEPAGSGNPQATPWAGTVLFADLGDPSFFVNWQRPPHSKNDLKPAPLTAQRA